MLDRLTAIAIDVASVSDAARDWAQVVGTASEAISPTRARILLGNISIEVEAAERNVGQESGGAPLLQLVFSTADLAGTARRLERRGLGGCEVGSGRLALAPAATHGTLIGIVGAGESNMPSRSMGSPGASPGIAGLDHVVIRTPDPERAVALYGGRLGLDLRLDRTSEKHGSRMLFFVVGDLVVEVVHDVRKGVGTGGDRVFGIALRASDVEQAHARMTLAGVAVSELREGRRPGTRVFTVKSHTTGVPTLVIGGEGLERS